MMNLLRWNLVVMFIIFISCLCRWALTNPSTDNSLVSTLHSCTKTCCLHASASLLCNRFFVCINIRNSLNEDITITADQLIWISTDAYVPSFLPQPFSSFSSYKLCIILRQHLVVVVVLGRLTLVIAIDIKEVVGNKIDIFVFVSLEEVSHELITVAAAVRSTPPAWLPESSVAATGIFLSANAFLPPTPSNSIFI